MKPDWKIAMFRREPHTYKRNTILRLVRTTLSLAVVMASILFLAVALRGSWGELKNMVRTEYVFTAILSLSIAYGCAYFFLAAAWHHILQQTSPVHAPFGTAAYVYCLSNIAKYLPGNVFHFASRQYLGARVGWGHMAIARASLIEIGTNVAAVCGIIVLAIAFSPSDFIEYFIPESWRPTTVSTATILSLATVVVVLGLFGFGRTHFFSRFLGVRSSSLLLVLGLNGCFFLSYFAMAIALTVQITDHPATPLDVFGIAYLIAWLAGFVIPGAPGGIGVREGILVLLLSGSGVESASALALGLGMRIVTILGDLFSGAIGYLLGRNGPAIIRS